MRFHKKLKTCYLKIDVSYEASATCHHISQNTTPATQFPLCHHFAQPCQCDSQKTRNTTRLKCCTCHETRTSCSENVAKVLRLPRKNDFRDVIKYVHMSQSATPATRNEATSHMKPPNMLPFATFPIGTELRRDYTTTTSDDKRRETTTWHAGNEHRSNPQTPNYKQEPFATHSGKILWGSYLSKRGVHFSHWLPISVLLFSQLCVLISSSGRFQKSWFLGFLHSFPKCLDRVEHPKKLPESSKIDGKLEK